MALADIWLICVRERTFSWLLKSELTDSNPHWAVKVSEMFKEWSYQFDISRVFPRPSGNLSPGLQSSTPSLCPLQHTGYHLGVLHWLNLLF